VIPKTFEQFWFGIVIPTIVLGSIGTALGLSIAVPIIRTDAVKHGVGQYNPQTAAFEWKECPCP